MGVEKIAIKIYSLPYIGQHLQSANWFHRSYLLDWLAAVLVFVVCEAISFWVNPFQRYLPTNDPSVLFPKENDIVSVPVLMILSIVVPALVIMLAQIFWKNAHDCHHGLLALFVAIALTNAVTAVLKTAAGRYRPNWLSTYMESGDPNEGRYSFPSGHSSNAFAGLVFLVLYLMGKFQVFHERHQFNFFKALPILSILCLPFFISISRTIDYHHNFSDVIGGALIGTGFSFFAYFLYYPPLGSEKSHLPKIHKELEIQNHPTPQISLNEVVVSKPIGVSKEEIEGMDSPSVSSYKL